MISAWWLVAVIPLSMTIGACVMAWAASAGKDTVAEELRDRLVAVNAARLDAQNTALDQTMRANDLEQALAVERAKRKAVEGIP